ncbi:MAG: NAD-dependent epimerase/dehydratase family protein [Pseudomonadota bacterium]
MRRNQRVLVLGGTGSIGGPVADVLRQRGHQVTCLARSGRSQQALRAAGFKTIHGDIRSPDDWTGRAGEFDAVINAASTWSDDEAQVERRLITKLLQAFSTPDAGKTVIYTDGCWSYGATGDTVATEETPFDPLPEFASSIETARMVRDSRQVRGMVIYPAMVYERDGGVLEQMADDARHRDRVRIVGGEDVRWPLVHRMDLALLYALMLERGEAGACFNGAGIVSMQVGRIARTLARRFGKPDDLEVLTVDQAVRDIGSWAVGYALDQQMSGAKAVRELGWAPEHTDILAELS